MLVRKKLESVIMRMSALYPENVSSVDNKVLSYLNCSKRQGMFGDFLRARKSESKSVKILIAYDEDLIIGWAVVFLGSRSGYKDPNFDFQVYVRQTYRRQGVGSSLYKAAENLFHESKKTIKCYMVKDLFYRKAFERRNRSYFSKIKKISKLKIRSSI